jgi:hypothetical protein
MVVVPACCMVVVDATSFPVDKRRRRSNYIHMEIALGEELVLLPFPYD